MLVSHHIDSFDLFVEFGIHQIMIDEGDIVVRTEDNFGKRRFVVCVCNPKVLNPMSFEVNRSQRIMYPSEARRLNKSYDASVVVTVIETEEDDQGNVINRCEHLNVEICKMPIILRSSRCNLSKLTKEERIKKGENPNDPGGYFIINGKDRFLNGQKRNRYNFPFVSINQVNGEVLCELRSMSDETGHSAVVKLKWSEENIFLMLTRMKSFVNLGTYLKASKVKCSKMFLTKVIGNDSIYEKTIQNIMFDFLRNSQEEASELVNNCAKNDTRKTEFVAMKMGIRAFNPPALLKNLPNSHDNGNHLTTPLSSSPSSSSFPHDPLPFHNTDHRKTANGSGEKKKIIAEKTFTFELLPHMGVCTSKIRKLLLLCFVIRKMIKVGRKLVMEDSKDSFRVKRIEFSGFLCSDLFKMLFKKSLKSIKNVLLSKKIHNFNSGSSNFSCSSGLHYSFSTGLWGVQRNNYIRDGVSQTFPNKFGEITQASCTRKFVKPSCKDSRKRDIRRIDQSSVGFVCPCETPEGHDVGITNHMASLAKSSQRWSPVVISEMLESRLFQIDSIDLPENPCANYLDLCDGHSERENEKRMRPAKNKFEISFVLVNGLFVGFTNEPEILCRDLRQWRKNHVFPRDVSIAFTKELGLVEIECDSGRLIRPLFNLERLMRFSLEEMSRTNFFVFDNLLEKGLVEYLDSNEIDKHAYIAVDFKSAAETIKNLSSNQRHTHVELHEQSLTGIATGVIPFMNCSQSPRLCYQACMMKQAFQGMPSSFTRIDVFNGELEFTQQPLVTTAIMRTLGLDKWSNGMNAIVAVMCYTGFNQEDSIIVNKGSIERGLFGISYSKTHTASEKKGDNGFSVTIGIPPEECRKKNVNYKNISENGLPKIGTKISEGSVIIAKFNTFSKRKENGGVAEGGAAPTHSSSTRLPDPSSDGPPPAPQQFTSKKSPAPPPTSNSFQKTSSLFSRASRGEKTDFVLKMPKSAPCSSAGGPIGGCGATHHPGSPIDPRNPHSSISETNAASRDQQSMCFFDDSLVAKAQDGGTVWNAFITNSNGLKTANVVIVSFKQPETGDKLCSGMAQKGTIGLVMPEADMPFCEDGLIPDLIINPHCFPGRMTVNQIKACWAGTAAVVAGTNKVDGTPFVRNAQQDFAAIESILKEHGYHQDGTRQMFEGPTGRAIKTRVFIGPTFYHRLNHLVQNKLHARPHGLVTITTRQPNCGRSKNGGLRLGEMEVTCMIVHGISSFITERLFWESDSFAVSICQICGFFSNDDEICHMCNSSQVYKIKMPFAMKQLCHQLMASGIKLKFALE